MPRGGKASELRWLKGPKGVSVFHFMNAFEGNGKVHVDMHLSDTNAFPFIRAASGIERQPWEIGGGFVRWSFDPAGDAIEEAVLGPPGDLPRLPDADQGRPYMRAWYLSMNPEAAGPPLIGGPVGGAFNSLLRIEPDTGRIDAMNLPPAHAIHEPVHIPARDHGGWLLAIVDRQAGENDYAHEAWVVHADDVAAPPVARIAIPARLRAQVHGWWAKGADIPGFV
jgi:carotenoid cleavage dioxygenase